jgi:hypothetical protein
MSANPLDALIASIQQSVYWQRLQPCWRGRSAGVLIALIAATLALMVGCGAGSIIFFQRLTAMPDGYLGGNATGVAFVQFAEDANSHLTGSWQVVEVNSDQRITSENVAFTGTRNGSHLTLTFSALDISTTITGTLTGDTLTFQDPDPNTGYIITAVFHGASIEQYNEAVAVLRRHVAATVTQLALDQAVTNANDQLSHDLSNLSSDNQALAAHSDFSDALSTYAKVWTQMQKDYQQEKSDYANGCGGPNGWFNEAVVASDANMVASDLSNIQYDDSALRDGQESVNTALSSVQNDLQSVQTAWQNVQAAVSADKKGHVSEQFTQHDVDSVIAAANSQIMVSRKALSDAQSSASTYDKEATHMNTDAQNLSNSLHC